LEGGQNLARPVFQEGEEKGELTMKQLKHFALGVLVMAAALFTATALLDARSGGHSSGHSTHSTSAHAHRSREARAEFMRQHPCPSTGKGSGACPGYVVDHVKPLACGGADAPSNMQWQTIAEGKAKDKWERIGCK
jgi:hypothetical protein